MSPLRLSRSVLARLLPAQRALTVLIAAIAMVVSAVATVGATGLEPLTVVTTSGRHSFSVEVMRSAEEKAQGLMERSHMPDDRGMLFDFGKTEPVSMWMKNTVMSLDMVFIRADGTIARISEHTEPFSTRIIPSGEPVLAVLELNAGAAERIGAKPGDKVEHALFANK